MSNISTGHAKKLIENYVINKIGEKITPLETRGIWFSKEAILEALNDPIHGVMPNGIRFYFGAYESFDPSGKKPPRYVQDQNKITLVMIPTTHKLDDTGKIITHPYRLPELLPFDLLTDPNADPKYDDKSFKEGNDGQICPPPAPIL